MRFFSVFSLVVFSAMSAVQAVDYYECGLYTGAETGWAFIGVPSCNDFTEEQTMGIRSEPIESCQGDWLTWGARVGYNYPVCPHILLGGEVAYHDNGFSSITFSNGNEYRLESANWDLLASYTQIICPGFWFNVKAGVASMRQIYRIWNVAETGCIDPTSVTKKWAPTASFSLGYNFCNFDLFVAYRGVYGCNPSKMSQLFTLKGVTFDEGGKIMTSPGFFELKDKVATVHGVYIGLQASLY